MNICKCINCQDKGVIKILKQTADTTGKCNISYRSEWCTCSKGKYLKKESQKYIYDYI